MARRRSRAHRRVVGHRARREPACRAISARGSPGRCPVPMSSRARAPLASGVPRGLPAALLGGHRAPGFTRRSGECARCQRRDTTPRRPLGVHRRRPRRTPPAVAVSSVLARISACQPGRRSSIAHCDGGHGGPTDRPPGSGRLGRVLGVAESVGEGARAAVARVRPPAPIPHRRRRAARSARGGSSRLGCAQAGRGLLGFLEQDRGPVRVPRRHPRTGRVSALPPGSTSRVATSRAATPTESTRWTGASRIRARAGRHSRRGSARR